MPEPRQFDLVIIGGGSGNMIVSRELSHLSIALIDDGEHFGGTCLNAGCIPTKMFVHVADVAADALESAPLGLAVPQVTADWIGLRDRIFGRIDALSVAGFRNRDQKVANVTVFRETFTFTGQHELVGASGVRLTAPRIVIAAGSRPRNAPWTSAPGVHDSDSVMRIADLPKSMVIVGGGAIAAEFAHVFHSFGVAVTQVVRAARLLDSFDDDIADRFTSVVAWRLITGATVESVADGVVTLADGTQLEAESVLSAIGRVPNTDSMELATAGFDLHADGRVKVDAFQRVLAHGLPVDGVFALGDISSEWQLKHVANHEARIVKHNILRPDELIGADPGPIPAAIFSHPQVAHFGLTERDAPDAISVVRHYSSTAWGWSLEDTTSFCKLIVDATTGQILGAHIIGPEASILIQVLVLAASRQIPIHGLARSMYWPHPAASEIVENALLDAENQFVLRKPQETRTVRNQS